MPLPSQDLLEFAEQLISVLERGRKSATYKYAVLLALMDLCLTTRTDTGAAPTTLTTVQLAERIVELYWPHARPFVLQRRGATSRVLRQNNRGQAEIVSAIQRFREKVVPDPNVSLARARMAHPTEFAALRRTVEWKLVEMPLPRLQTLFGGDQDEPFLYEIAWTEAITPSQFRDARTFDNRILLKPDVGERLVRLSGLLRPMVERQWAAMVARLNDDLLDDAELEEFLFGVNRAALDPVKRPLLELQQGTCFYCAKRVDGKPQVDHFIPWVRHPTDALDNLVVAHDHCNNDKSDHLVATPHLEKWRSHVVEHDSSLFRIAHEKRWQEPTGATLAVVRAIYFRLRPGARLWEREHEYARADLGAIRSALA